MTHYPERYLKGLRLFNARYYWHTHEELEELWKPLREDPRDFYQGIILAAAGLWHVDHSGRWWATARLFRKALLRLSPYPEAYMGLDLAELRGNLERGLPLLEVPREQPPGTEELQTLHFEIWSSALPGPCRPNLLPACGPRGPRPGDHHGAPR